MLPLLSSFDLIRFALSIQNGQIFWRPNSRAEMILEKNNNPKPKWPKQMNQMAWNEK